MFACTWQAEVVFVCTWQAEVVFVCTWQAEVISQMTPHNDWTERVEADISDALSYHSETSVYLAQHAHDADYLTEVKGNIEQKMNEIKNTAKTQPPDDVMFVSNLDKMKSAISEFGSVVTSKQGTHIYLATLLANGSPIGNCPQVISFSIEPWRTTVRLFTTT